MRGASCSLGSCAEVWTAQTVTVLKANSPFVAAVAATLGSTLPAQRLQRPNRGYPAGWKKSRDNPEMLCRRPQRCPDTLLKVWSHFFRKTKIRWHDTDDRVRHPADLNHVANDADPCNTRRL